MTADPISIPRALNEGVDATLAVGVAGAIISIEVVVDITHPDISKLQLSLVSPDDASYLLFDGSAQGAGQADLATIFPTETPVIDALGPLVGQPVAGLWRLHAVDSHGAQPEAIRRINAWGLNIIRRSEDAWRLSRDLVVEGEVRADILCRISPILEGGIAVGGVISLSCGNQPAVRLATVVCANGRVDAGEECDDGNFANGDGCDRACQRECGNGRDDPNEECDDGNLTPTDGCTDACRTAFCGDNIVYTGVEECDEGGANSDEPGATCRLNCQRGRCGDGIRDPAEACDRGALNSDEPGAPCRVDCKAQRCGDAITDPGEECDDGNAAEDDDCRNNCLVRHRFLGLVQPGNTYEEENAPTLNNEACVTEYGPDAHHCSEAEVDGGYFAEICTRLEAAGQSYVGVNEGGEYANDSWRFRCKECPHTGNNDWGVRCAGPPIPCCM